MTAEPEWVTVEEVIALNKRAVAATKEPYFLVNHDGLESAVDRQKTHFDFAERGTHDDLVLLGAKLCVGISEAQAFIQGNKRTGLAAMQMLFNLNGYAFSPHAYGHLADLVLATANPDHAVRMDVEEFAELVDEFVVESEGEFVRGGRVSDFDIARMTVAMGRATDFTIGDNVTLLGAGSVGLNTIANATMFAENMTIVDALGILTPDTYRKLGGLDLGKITFKRQDPDDAE